MTKAIRIHAPGGPEAMVLDDVEVAAPGPGQARVRHHAIGLNFIDIYHRTGLYTLAMPAGIGSEGAGVVEAVGDGVTNVKVGDRVAYAVGAARLVLRGAHHRRRPAGQAARRHLLRDRRAAMMLKGMTVQYLIQRTFKVQPGETVLFHAAAGGVGLIACQWLKALGVTVIGTVGLGREGGARQGARLRPRDRLHAARTSSSG